MSEGELAEAGMLKRMGGYLAMAGKKVTPKERDFFIDNLLVRIHFIIVMVGWTGLAPWEFEFAFPGSLTCPFLGLSGHSVHFADGGNPLRQSLCNPCFGIPASDRSVL